MQQAQHFNWIPNVSPKQLTNDCSKIGPEKLASTDLESDQETFLPKENVGISTSAKTPKLVQQKSVQQTKMMKTHENGENVAKFIH